MRWEPVVHQCLELKGVAITAYAMRVIGKNRPDYEGESMVMRAGILPALQWAMNLGGVRGGGGAGTGAWSGSNGYVFGDFCAATHSNELRSGPGGRMLNIGGMRRLGVGIPTDGQLLRPWGGGGWWRPFPGAVGRRVTAAAAR